MWKSPNESVNLIHVRWEKSTSRTTTSHTDTHTRTHSYTGPHRCTIAKRFFKPSKFRLRNETHRNGMKETKSTKHKMSFSSCVRACIHISRISTVVFRQHLQTPIDFMYDIFIFLFFFCFGNTLFNFALNLIDVGFWSFHLYFRIFLCCSLSSIFKVQCIILFDCVLF